MNDKPMTITQTERLNALQHEISEYAKVLRHTPLGDHAKKKMLLVHLSELADEYMRERGMSEAEIAEIRKKIALAHRANMGGEMR